MSRSRDDGPRKLSPLLVTARLLNGLGGDRPPQLDALLERMLAHHCADAVPAHLVDRNLPAPPQGVIPIPICRRPLGPWLVGCCSDPIAGFVHDDRHEYIAKRIGVEDAAMLAPDRRVVVATTNSWTKGYRLPLRTRRVECVRWFALGNKGRLADALRRCTSIGKKISVGYGRVAGWDVETAGHDHSWFAPSDAGPVLMRTLPVGDWLPAGLTGYRRDFGACCSPYWHPDRWTEILVPA